MNDPALQHIEAIHSMLAAGQRPVRMERASLAVWGLVMGGLCAGLESALRPFSHLPQPTLAFIVCGVITAGVTLAAYLDRTLTRRARMRRGESIAFVECQIAKAWMLLIALGVALTFATFFFGGAPMVYAVWLVLIGVGLFLHGLFSEQLPEWVGTAMIMLGIVPLAAGASYAQTRWLAAAAFGIGLPLLAAMLDGGARAALAKRLGQSLAWLAAVLGAAFLGWQAATKPAADDAPIVSLDAYLAQHESSAGRTVVHIPAGAIMPLGITMEDDLLATEPGSTLMLRVQQPVELLLEDGKPTGYSRIPGEEWRRSMLRIVGAHTEDRDDAAHLFLGASLNARILRMR